MEFKLRDYQEEGKRAVQDEWARGVQSTMVVWATGLGKTELIVSLANDLPGRALVVCPLLTLIGQTCKKFLDRTGVMPAIEQANLRSNEAEWGQEKFIVASKETLTRTPRWKKRVPFTPYIRNPHRYMKFKNIDLLVIDEAHLFATRPAWEMVQWFKERGTKILLVTATPQRLDDRSMANLCDSCAHQYGIVHAIRDGWLVEPKAKTVELEDLDLSGVKKVAGDFNKAQLNRALEEEKAIFEITDVVVRESGDMKTAIYCSSVVEAQKVSDRLTDHYGKKSEWICSYEHLCTKERKSQVIESFRKPGGLQFVVNVNLLSLGWDFPGLEHIVMAQPTQSISRYTQVLGRATRPLPGIVDRFSTPAGRLEAIKKSEKPNFFVTDLVDNSKRHQIRTTVDAMAGDIGIPLMEQAKKVDSDDYLTVTEIMDAADKLLQAEEDRKKAEEIAENARKQAEQEAKERKRLAAIKARAQYSVENANLFEDPSGQVKTKQRSARFTYGKYRGEPVSQVPTWYLEFANKKPNLPAWLARAIDRELEFRKNESIDDGGIMDIARSFYY